MWQTKSWSTKFVKSNRWKQFVEWRKLNFKVYFFSGLRYKICPLKAWEGWSRINLITFLAWLGHFRKQFFTLIQRTRPIFELFLYKSFRLAGWLVLPCIIWSTQIRTRHLVHESQMSCQIAINWKRLQTNCWKRIFQTTNLYSLLDSDCSESLVACAASDA